MSEDGGLERDAPPLQPLRLPHGASPSPASVAAHLTGLGVEPYAWSNPPNDRYAVHQHEYTKLLMCAAGSITFQLGSGAAISLHPGEGFVLPPSTPHSAMVGPEGCTCLEGHRAD